MWFNNDGALCALRNRDRKDYQREYTSLHYSVLLSANCSNKYCTIQYITVRCNTVQRAIVSLSTKYELQYPQWQCDIRDQRRAVPLHLQALTSIFCAWFALTERDFYALTCSTPFSSCSVREGKSCREK
jgi:hypothetical protein